MRDLQRVLRELERHAADATKDRGLFDLTADERGRLSHERSDGARVGASLHDHLGALVVCERLLPVGQRLRVFSVLVRSHERGDLVHLFGHRHHAGADVEVTLHGLTDLAALGLEQPGVHAHQLRVDLRAHGPGLVRPVQSLALVRAHAPDLIDIDVSADVLVEAHGADHLDRVLVHLARRAARHHVHLRCDHSPHGHGVDHR